jgi:hypothetical protein
VEDLIKVKPFIEMKGLHEKSAFYECLLMINWCKDAGAALTPCKGIVTNTLNNRHSRNHPLRKQLNISADGDFLLK